MEPWVQGVSATFEEAKTLPIQVDGVMLEATGNATWTTDAGPFDVLSELKDSIGRAVHYEKLVSRSFIVRGNGFTVRVASVDDIIAAKAFVDRERDRETLPELLEIQEREHSFKRQGRFRPEAEFKVNDDPHRAIEP